VSLLVGENTHDACSGYSYRFIDTVMVKGKEEPVRIYEPLCRLGELSDDQQALEALHSRAMTAYLSQHWDEAESLFQEIQQTHPCQQVELLLARIPQLRQQRLSLDWDGAFQHTQK
jgi:adenylate cyclase